MNYEEEIDFVVNDIKRYSIAFFGARTDKEFFLNIVYDIYNQFQKDLIFSFFNGYYKNNKDYFNHQELTKNQIREIALENYFEIK